MPDSTQGWRVPVSGEERWLLFRLIFSQDERGVPRVMVSSHEESKAFRQMLRAFGIPPIREAAKRSEVRNRNAVHPARLINDEPDGPMFGPPAAHNLMINDVAFVLSKVACLPRAAMNDVVVGDLFERLEQAQRADDPAWADVPDYNAASESWDPTPAQIAEDVRREEELEALRAAQAVAVGRGG
jgi:hypothetical protein